jgi:hypothetical protein
MYAKRKRHQRILNRVLNENSPLVAVARRRDPCLATLLRVLYVVYDVITVYTSHGKYSGRELEYGTRYCG